MLLDKGQLRFRKLLITKVVHKNAAIPSQAPFDIVAPADSTILQANSARYCRAQPAASTGDSALPLQSSLCFLLSSSVRPLPFPKVPCHSLELRLRLGGL